MTNIDKVEASADQSRLHNNLQCFDRAKSGRSMPESEIGGEVAEDSDDDIPVIPDLEEISHIKEFLFLNISI